MTTFPPKASFYQDLQKFKLHTLKSLSVAKFVYGRWAQCPVPLIYLSDLRVMHPTNFAKESF